MASTPSPDTGTVLAVAGAGVAMASVALKALVAPVAAVAPMKWGRSMGLGVPRIWGAVRFKNRACRAVPPRDGVTRLMAVGGQQSEENGLPGAQQRGLRHPALATSERPPVRRRRDVDELRKWRSGSGRFQGAPIEVIAEIPARIARHPGWYTRRAGRSEKMAKWRAPCERRPAARNRPF